MKAVGVALATTLVLNVCWAGELDLIHDIQRDFRMRLFARQGGQNLNVCADFPLALLPLSHDVYYPTLSMRDTLRYDMANRVLLMRRHSPGRWEASKRQLYVASVLILSRL